MNLLDVKKLTMQFGGLTAVKDVDLQVHEGEIVSVIGPNGAGKTTVFNAITGIYDPTQGSIEFAGRELRRPWTWRVVLACVAIGLLTGIFGALIAADIDKLWMAAIKRPFADTTHPFSYLSSWRHAHAYLRRDLAIESTRSKRKRWLVTTADGRTTLANVTTEAEAEEQLQLLQSAIDSAPLLTKPREFDGSWRFALPNDTPHFEFATEEEARHRRDQLLTIHTDDRWRRLATWGGLIVGVTFGTAGAAAVWNRSRRTPDVIAAGGIARTFQNIRLFQNMSVLENVLVGMDRDFSRNPLSIVFRTPAFRRGEQAGGERAQELLKFVGLAGKQHTVAKSLPYGDQRRLEIARALGSRPKLLLLDEPAAGMNPSEKDSLMALIRKIRSSGVTVLLIEHHMRLVMDISDRIAVLEYGRKIAEGTPAEVRSNPRVIEAYLGKEEVS